MPFGKSVGNAWRPEASTIPISPGPGSSPMSSSPFGWRTSSSTSSPSASARMRRKTRSMGTLRWRKRLPFSKAHSPRGKGPAGRSPQIAPGRGFSGRSSTRSKPGKRKTKGGRASCGISNSNHPRSTAPTIQRQILRLRGYSGQTSSSKFSLIAAGLSRLFPASSRALSPRSRGA